MVAVLRRVGHIHYFTMNNRHSTTDNSPDQHFNLFKLIIPQLGQFHYDGHMKKNLPKKPLGHPQTRNVARI